jgi:hypothetical protein
MGVSTPPEAWGGHKITLKKVGRAPAPTKHMLLPNFASHPINGQRSEALHSNASAPSKVLAATCSVIPTPTPQLPTITKNRGPPSWGCYYAMQVGKLARYMQSHGGQGFMLWNLLKKSAPGGPTPQQLATKICTSMRMGRCKQKLFG